MYTYKAGRTPELQQNWQSSEKSKKFKEKTQYLMNNLYNIVTKLALQKAARPSYLSMYIFNFMTIKLYIFKSDIFFLSMYSSSINSSNIWKWNQPVN